MRLLAAIALFLFNSSSATAAALDPHLDSILQQLRPGEDVSVIVTLKDQVPLDRFHNNSRFVRSLSVEGRRQHRRDLVVALKNKAVTTQGALRGFLNARGARHIESLWIHNGMAVTAGRELVEDLSKRPEVAQIRLNGIQQLPAYTISQMAAPEWNQSAIHAPELWSRGVTGQGVVIATLDSGVDLNHEALVGTWRGGANSWFDPYGEHPVLPFDASGHGTAVTGILLGKIPGGPVIGTAPDARWIAAKTFNDVGVAENFRIHQSFQWLLDPDGNPDTDDSPDIVNNSWGFDLSAGECVEEFRADVQALRAAGIGMAFAAGNTGWLAGSDISPANYPESFAVGAIDWSLAVPLFSARGPSRCDGTAYPEVVAPGVHIRTADLTMGGIFPAAYTVVEGTSFATPHVAGAMALLLAARPELSVDQLEAALRATATDLGQPGADNGSGSGLINVLAAYTYLAENAPHIAILPSASYLNFGKVPVSSSASQLFTVTNTGVVDLLIGNMTMTGANFSEFTVGSDSCSLRSLAPNAGCSFKVTFTPQTAGKKAAALQIPSNAPMASIILVGNEQIRIGTFRGGEWFLDNGNGGWDAGLDTVLANFGVVGDLPAVGDMNGDGFSEVGVYHPPTGAWYFDLDNSGSWSGCGVDLCLAQFGIPSDIPVTGDWDGNGRFEIGVYRNGQWYFDMDGSGTWDPAKDAFKQNFGAPGHFPVTGDWNGDGKTEIGTYFQGTWYLDNGNGRWDGAGIDTVNQNFGALGHIPVTGDWNGDGKTEVGTFFQGTWYLDNGNGRWDGVELDTAYQNFGIPSDKPVTGLWR